MQGRWNDVDQVERAIFQWITWYNEERLHSALHYVPPAEYEEASWRSRSKPRGPPESTKLSQSKSDSTKLGAAQSAPLVSPGDGRTAPVKSFRQVTSIADSPRETKRPPSVATDR
ncbi:integrase core domain-containing protein [Streptomyces sp. NPDC094468]|uniref:integrase core domain-containing protein n=1 Tax=Streptomyces sp. NPDC094468 TaxID=3366066 RepID=UPI00380B0526